MDIELVVDGEDVELNEFVQKILMGTVTGAVGALRGIKKDWKQIKIEITK